ncbi:MAG: hypothetical protein K2M34_04280 [Alphaproteobacteria bacterium]|nr:hypothetical protein [Alphaproteobacteria bacterium]
MFRFIVMAVLLAGCNSVYVKPNTLDTDAVIYASRGGYSMKRSIKQEMEKRGYNVVVGRAKSSRDYDGDTDIDMSASVIPNNAKYIVKVAEHKETFRPIWCALNGFWWWNFNVSIAEQDSGKEILSWRGRGCQNSSLRKLDTILDKMEKAK